MMLNPPFIEGPRVYLRALSEADASGPYLTWFNDPEVCRGNSHHTFPFLAEEALAYIRGVNQGRSELVLALVLREDGRHIGNLSLQNINWLYRSAEFAIVIGDRQVWGQGYAKEAARLLCDHGFQSLNLNRIACATFDNNPAMQKLALYLGMSEEGRRRQAAYKDGIYLDVIEYGVLKNEYEARWLSRR